jgi:Xaa-Pro aminopeptidase
VEAKWRGIGMRIEEVILVTPEANRNLSDKLPRNVKEVEAVLKKRD